MLNIIQYMYQTVKECLNMTKMVITEKRISKRELYRVINECYRNKFTIRYKRGQIYVFFPNKDLTHEHACKIARLLHMEIISESYVRVVIGY